MRKLCGFSILLITLGLPSMATGQNANAPKYSDETKSIEFSFGGARFSVPRNHIVYMDDWEGGEQEGGSIVVITLTYPEMRPFSEEASDCFVNKECKKITLSIMMSSHLSAPRYFEGLKALSHRVQQDGRFQVFSIGPEESRIDLLEKNGVRYMCMPQQINAVLSAVCQRFIRINNGAELHINFSWSYIFESQYREKTDDKIEQLELFISRLVSKIIRGGG